MTPGKKVSYNWPNFLNSTPITKDGEWSGEWQMLMQDFFTYAQNNLGAEGHVMPNQSSDNINTIANSDSVRNGTVWFDETNQVLKVKLGGIVRTIALVP